MNYQERAKKIIVKEFDGRHNLQCQHSNRQFDDDMCDACFKKRLRSLVTQALREVEEATARKCMEISERRLVEDECCIRECRSIAKAITKEFGIDQ